MFRAQEGGWLALGKTTPGRYAAKFVHTYRLLLVCYWTVVKIWHGGSDLIGRCWRQNYPTRDAVVSFPSVVAVFRNFRPPRDLRVCFLLFLLLQLGAGTTGNIGDNAREMEALSAIELGENVTLVCMGYPGAELCSPTAPVITAPTPIPTPAPTKAPITPSVSFHFGSEVSSQCAREERRSSAPRVPKYYN